MTRPTDSARAASVAAADLPGDACLELAEFQGLYGAYHVSETLVQKIWLRGAFDRDRAATIAGASVRIVHPGAWNRLSGPDFRGARLVLGDREVTGDIEVHFHAEAWKHHGHDADPAYAQVVLHVVLFPPPPGFPPARTCDGREIPVLVLVDLLWHDLEEYATDEAVTALSGRDAMPLVEDLLALPAEERRERIRAAASLRWQEKVRTARVRIERCGWAEACHLTALEILGYRANREPMLRVGARHPWSAWCSPGHGAPTVDQLLAAGADGWTTRGVRPLNQPRLRLEQYSRWMVRVPDWPERLRSWSLPDLPEEGGGTLLARRRRAGLTAARVALGEALTGAELGGLRLDTLITNLALPFLAASGSATQRAEAWWRVWTPGDIAEVVLEAARCLGPAGPREPRSNELVQGLLGLHLQQAFARRPA